MISYNRFNKKIFRIIDFWLPALGLFYRDISSPPRISLGITFQLRDWRHGKETTGSQWTTFKNVKKFVKENNFPSFNSSTKLATNNAWSPIYEYWTKILWRNMLKLVAFKIDETYLKHNIVLNVQSGTH